MSCVRTKSAVVKFNWSVKSAEPMKSPVSAPPCCSNVTASPAPDTSTEALPPTIVPEFTKLLFTAATATSATSVEEPTVALFSAVRFASRTVIVLPRTARPTSVPEIVPELFTLTPAPVIKTPVLVSPVPEITPALLITRSWSACAPLIYIPREAPVITPVAVFVIEPLITASASERIAALFVSALAVEIVPEFVKVKLT